MTRVLLLAPLCLLAAGCGMIEDRLFGTPPPAPAVRDGSDRTHPRPRPGTPGVARPVDGQARTAETLDTTSARERAAAREGAAPAGGETDLGVTVASLGAVGEPGIWLRTPLVDRPARGRVEYPGKGTAVAVDLIPMRAEPGAGSRISLAAMRLLKADLTALPELHVYRTE